MRLTSLFIAAALLFCSGRYCTAETDQTAPPLTKSPTTAVVYSLMLPGLGQYYTEEYWKIPLFTGTCLTTGILFFYYNNEFNSTSNLYDQAVETGAPSNVITSLRSQREAYRDNRDLSGLIFVLSYALAAVDAYVGAHLFDFDISDDLSMSIRPHIQNTSGISVVLRW